MCIMLKNLPPDLDLETKAIHRKLASAHRYLAELNQISANIPNQALYNVSTKES